MDAGKSTISGVFNGSRLLEIPFYQRAYVWGEEQWERFLLITPILLRRSTCRCYTVPRLADTCQCGNR